MKKFLGKYVKEDMKFDKLTMLGIIALIIVISGIFGWVYEFIFYFFNSNMKTWYYRGGNFLPWINIYAIGALAIYFFAYKYRKSPLKVFLISAVTTGVLEFIAGWGMYTFFDHFRCWDYNTEILSYGSIGGFVCIRSVFLFGISSLLLIYGIVPMCFYLASKMNKKLFLIISFSICFIFLFDEIYNLVIARIINAPRASDIYKKIGFKYMDF